MIADLPPAPKALSIVTPPEITRKVVVVGANVSYHIYKPPIYQHDRARRFPVLYWLHGTEGGEGAFARWFDCFTTRWSPVELSQCW
ncbi:hypothetical protein [Novipirellula aureliae]